MAMAEPAGRLLLAMHGLEYCESYRQYYLNLGFEVDLHNNNLDLLETLRGEGLDSKKKYNKLVFDINLQNLHIKRLLDQIVTDARLMRLNVVVAAPDEQLTEAEKLLSMGVDEMVLYSEVPKVKMEEYEYRNPDKDDCPMALVIDDCPVSRKIVTHFLRLYNCEFDTANDGVQGLAKYNNGSYDFIIIDCEMPKLNGIEVAKQIRAFEASAAHIPIIAMTGAVKKGYRDECLDAGMDDYVEKPVGAVTIRKILRKLMP